MSGQRQDNLARLRKTADFDAVVIGGGINGIGVYRDLALQGLRVLLIERNDYCSGCSAAPSRMIHGGLRYLENGEFGLVRESLAERDALLRNAPHLVHPLPTLVPITSIWSGMLNSAAGFLGKKGKPANRGAVPIKLGLTLYDWVTRKRRVLPKHEFLSLRTTRRLWPALTPVAKRSAIYHDAWISHPERLCIELLRDVVRDTPDCIALNYAELRQTAGGYEVSDKFTGTAYPVSARVIVNATGAWVDDTAQGLGGIAKERMVSGTKGSHLILDHAQLHEALAGHMVYFENTDGRICIVFPYLGKVLAGSTDIRVDTAGRVRCEPEELDYILESLRLVFPDIPVSEKNVVFSYSGIRPLPQSDHNFTGRISRGHDVKRLDGKVPQFCMIGGKWTTFRAFAEQTADAVLAELGHSRKVSTKTRPIGGGADYDASPVAKDALVARFGIDHRRAAHLLGHYGSNASAVAEYCERHGSDALGPGFDMALGEARWAIEQEFAQTLSDILLRRGSLTITGQISMEAIDRIADVLAQVLDLSAADIERQKRTLIDELNSYHGVGPDMLIARDKKRRDTCL